MNKKINYIIREVPPEQCDFSFYLLWISFIL